MLTFLEKNSKERYKARLGAVSSGAKTSAVGAAEAILDSVPASGTMSQHEVNEVSLKCGLNVQCNLGEVKFKPMLASTARSSHIYWSPFVAASHACCSSCVWMCSYNCYALCSTLAVLLFPLLPPFHSISIWM